MGAYSWLGEKKKEAMAAKLQKRTEPSYRQLPISERYGVTFTGGGADGQINPQATAGMAGQPGNMHTFHEGETKASIPEGDMYVNADVTKMMMHPTNQDQMEANMYGKKGNLPGFATGGFAPSIGGYSSQIMSKPVVTPLKDTATNLAGQISNQINSTPPTADPITVKPPVMPNLYGTTQVPDAPTDPKLLWKTLSDPTKLGDYLKGIAPAPAAPPVMPNLYGTTQVPDTSVPKTTTVVPPLGSGLSGMANQIRSTVNNAATMAGQAAPKPAIPNLYGTTQVPDAPPVMPNLYGTTQVPDTTTTVGGKLPTDPAKLAAYLDNLRSNVPNNSDPMADAPPPPPNLYGTTQVPDAGFGTSSSYTGDAGFGGKLPTDPAKLAAYLDNLRKLVVPPPVVPPDITKTPPKTEPITLAGQINTTPVATAEDRSRNAGLDYLQGTLTGKTGIQLEGQRAMDELSARQQQERAAAEQRALQTGMSPAAAQAEAQILRNQQESELNSTAAKYGIAGMNEKAQTAGTLATQGLAGQQFENEKTKYGDTADWKAYETAIAAGDFTTAAQAYQRVTGNPISMEQMKANQAYMTTKQGQDITSGDLANDAAKLNITSTKMNQIIGAINSGANLATINATYGTNMDQAAFDSISAKYKQSIVSGDLAIDAAKFGLDAAKMNQMISDINNGVPRDTINKTYGINLSSGAYESIGAKYRITMDSLNTKLGVENMAAINDAIGKGASLDQINKQFPNARLSDADYKAMYEATPLGERTWERNMGYAKTLLAAGGPENIAAAAKMFNNAFPGTGIDFSKALTADKAATFNQGMSQLSDLVAAGMDYDAAMEVMKNDGTLEFLGSATDVEKIYRGLKTNAIDEQWNTIVESEWYKNLEKTDPEGAKDMQTFFGAVLSGKLDYNVQNEYTVTKDGKTSTMYFNTEADANRYGIQNGSTIVATGKSKVTPVTDILNPGNETVVIPPDVTGQEQGSIVLKEGKAYLVDAAGKPVEMTTIPDSIWGDDATAILAAGKQGNPLYSKVIDAQVTDIVDNQNWAKVVGLKATDPLIVKLQAKAVEWNPTTSYDSGGMFGTDKRTFTNAPAVNTVITHNGVIYNVESAPTMRKSGENTDTIQVRDVLTGQMKTLAISGNHNGSLTVSGW